MPAELKLLGQYVKDLSFESPLAPQFVDSLGRNPQLQLHVDVSVAPKAAETYEVTLNLDIHASNNGDIIYHLELTYGGLFRLGNIREELRQPVLFVDCPKLLFPFLRRVVADITGNGGFTPLMLDVGKLPGLGALKVHQR